VPVAIEQARLSIARRSASAALHRLSLEPLRDAALDDAPGDRRDQDRARAEDRSLPEGGEASRGQRIEQRTRFDLEMLNELGFCKGIENYSRHLSGRKEGEPPPTLIDYLPPNALMFVDESHVTVGQLGGMYRGDARARRTSSPTASGCHRRSTTGRSSSRNSRK